MLQSFWHDTVYSTNLDHIWSWPWVCIHAVFLQLQSHCSFLCYLSLPSGDNNTFESYLFQYEVLEDGSLLVVFHLFCTLPLVTWLFGVCAALILDIFSFLVPPVSFLKSISLSLPLSHWLSLICPSESVTALWGSFYSNLASHHVRRYLESGC